MSSLSVRSKRSATVTMTNARPATFDADAEAELKEAFDLFDRDGDQKIAAKELQVVLQALGRNMEQRDVEAHIKAIKRERRTEDDTPAEESLELNLEEFISFVRKEIEQNDYKEELVECFRNFGGNEEIHQGFTL